MAVKMGLQGVDNAFRELARKHQSFVKENDRKRTRSMIAELEAETPVDTGLAQNSWERFETGMVTNIVNTTPYIQYLNQGTSKQAPAYFVERIALRYGKPLGSVVTVIDN